MARYPPSMTLVRPTTALAWADLTDQALRVRATEAAATYDVHALIQVLTAYLHAGSKNGARTSPKTVAAYQLAVRTFVPWAQQSGMQLLRPGHRDGGRYLAHLQTSPGRNGVGHLAPASVAQYFAGARALYRALRWAGVTQLDPFTDTSAPADPTPGIVKNPPYMEEIEQVLPYCTPQLRALLLLCAHSGLRVSEALAAHSWDQTGNELSVTGKGGKVRLVPLGRRVREALLALPPGPYFPGLSYNTAARQMRRTFERAGLAGRFRGFHAARKTSGTMLYEATGDFTRVSLFLGHSSVDTTRRYVAVRRNDVAAEVENF
ncbi:Phage integrase (plasmid) [Deinococcus gobiensis I-0]|uniref:Phage integrase n=2 Tax=Deinococcus TaxID=1298 RepID=H8H401_DEIGI|nr:Phage integrase [Deinococcus gobiensis I-0]